MFNGSNCRLPFYVAIIRENKRLPHLPNEIWLMIEEAILQLFISYHERKFAFQYSRIRPFQCIYALHCQENVSMDPRFNVRSPTFRARRHQPVNIYFNRVRRVFNITNVVTVVDMEDQTPQRYCRNALLEGKALALLDKL